MANHILYAFIATTILSLNAASADDAANSDNTLSFKTAPVMTHLPTESIFKPFTGKIKGKKVRLRAQPDLEGSIIRELDKNYLLSVVGENNDFWAVEPPSDTKAYIFRSYVLDNKVEANHVNVRLQPDLESPIIGHLNAGDAVDGIISALNNKWYEISPPSNARFYIAKDFIENIGGPEVKVQLDKRKEAVEQLMDTALLLSKTELRKFYEEIDIERLTRNFQTIVNSYTDFPDYVEQAKESLAYLQESYLLKKIAFLEGKANPQDNEEAVELISEQNELVLENETAIEAPTERMKMWTPIEEGLYLSWMRMNEDRTVEDFYEEQLLNAVVLKGILEPYTSPVKNKPGDFILRDKDLPIAYLYSTQHNLQALSGKKIKVTVTPRDNNNFAFPAYYVLAVE